MKDTSVSDLHRKELNLHKKTVNNLLELSGRVLLLIKYLVLLQTFNLSYKISYTRNLERLLISYYYPVKFELADYKYLS